MAAVIIHLGVIDIPYTNGGITTFEVAQILEKRYGIMRFFVKQNKDKISAHVTRSLKNALVDIMQGAPLSLDPFAAAMENIQSDFRDFLDSHGMDGQKGVPTRAALTGKSSRYKRFSPAAAGFIQGKKKNAPGIPRPSFIDSGLYQATFKAWVNNGYYRK
jgi:hypothetical protein